MRLTISKAFTYCGYLILAGLLASLLASAVALQRLKIGSPAYHKIIAGKDLVADILPPPAYVIEAYLEAHLIAREPASLSRRLPRIEQLRSEYQARRDYWDGSEILPPRLKELVTRSDAEVQKFWGAIETGLAPAARLGDPAGIARGMTELAKAYQAHRVVVDEMVIQANAFAADAENEAAFEATIFRALMFGSAALVFVMVWAAIRYLRGRSSDRLAVMTAYLKKLGLGRYGEAVPYKDDEDEIGEVARAVNMFRKALVQQEESRARHADDERRHREENRLAEERAIRTERELVSSSIGAGLSELSRRNLTFRLAGELPETYRKLQADFNSAIADFEKAVGHVKGGVDAIAPGAAQIATSAANLARQAEQQAAGLERATTALQEITQSAQEIATGAGEANKIVRTTRSEAEESGAVVRQAVDAITRIERSSQSIGHIIGVVDEIAFQTNLLALNAGVEAARAGEAGRGFAVVASEVRALAQRSAEAAKEIKALISTSSAEVGQGVELVGLTGQALEKIVAHVVDLQQAVSNITARAMEQAKSLEDIQAVVGQIDRNTQTNSSMAEETTRASASLQEKMQDLAGVIGEFRVGHVEAARAVETVARPSRPVPVVALKTVGRGGAAPAFQENEWQEF